MSERGDSDFGESDFSKWGYVVYRTVYTQESDELWPSVLEKLETYMKLSCEKEERCDELFNVVISDQEKFNNASINELRKEFRKEMLVPEIDEDEDENEDNDSSEEDDDTFLRKAEIRNQKVNELREKGYGDHRCTGINFQFCICIDEEVFQSILNAPEPAEGMEIETGKYDYIGFVKVITLYKSSSRRERWPGWGRVDIRYLCGVYDDDEIERSLQSGRPPYDFEFPVINGSF